MLNNASGKCDVKGSSFQNKTTSVHFGSHGNVIKSTSLLCEFNSAKIYNCDLSWCPTFDPAHTVSLAQDHSGWRKIVVTCFTAER